MHILFISETKLEESFPRAQFAIKEFNKLRAIVHKLKPFLAPEWSKGWGWGGEGMGEGRHMKMNFDYFQTRK